MPNLFFLLSSRHVHVAPFDLYCNLIPSLLYVYVGSNYEKKTMAKVVITHLKKPSMKKKCVSF
jgi:hypothetical protein